MIEYTVDKMETLLGLFGVHICNLYDRVSDFYDPSKYYEGVLDELEND